MNANIHITPAGDMWAVQVEGGGLRTVFATQDEAIVAGTERAQRERVELLVHGLDGHIQTRNSFGHDLRNQKI